MLRGLQTRRQFLRLTLTSCGLLGILSGALAWYSNRLDISIDVVPNPSRSGYADLVVTNKNLFTLHDVRIGCFEDGLEFGRLPGLPQGVSMMISPATEHPGPIHKYRNISFRQKARFLYVPISQVTTVRGSQSLSPRWILTPKDLTRLSEGEYFVEPGAIHMVVFVRHQRRFLNMPIGGEVESRFSFVARRISESRFEWTSRSLNDRIPSVIQDRLKPDGRGEFNIYYLNRSGRPVDIDLQVVPRK